MRSLFRLFLRIWFCLVLAAVATFTLSAVVPRGLALTASTVCPESTVRSLVLHRPAPAVPSEKIRTYDLVCVDAGGVGTIADERRTLRTLFLASFVLLLLASFPVGLALAQRIPPDGPNGPPPKKLGISDAPSAFLSWFFSLMGGGFIFGGLIPLWLWLATDEPDISYSCGSGNDQGTCFRGESTFRTSGVGFVALGTGFFLASAISWTRRRRKRADRHHLWAHGQRAVGKLIEASPTGARQGGQHGRRIWDYTVEAAPIDGGPPFLVKEKGFTASNTTIGTPVDVLYDPLDIGRSLIVGYSASPTQSVTEDRPLVS